MFSITLDIAGTTEIGRLFSMILCGFDFGIGISFESLQSGKETSSQKHVDDMV